MLFVGAVGKSAQLPLYLWLPDAMAGPTPVSALIHAATMVTAGVYLMVRINPVLHASSPWLSTAIAWVGVLTALFAATIAIAQTDIKKVLAYSTVSQLGYMFLAVGSGGYWAAIFHMITHAFFKALLFLGAGSVIHGMHDEQDMRRMGALRKLMPITAGTFIVGWLAISGVIPFSGFWSKDEILTYALHKSVALYAVGLFTALLTAFYMSRAGLHGLLRRGPVGRRTVRSPVAVASRRRDHGRRRRHRAARPTPATRARHSGVHPHESPWTMTFPLVVLAFLAAVAGFLNLPFSGRGALAGGLAGAGHRPLRRGADLLERPDRRPAGHLDRRGADRHRPGLPGVSQAPGPDREVRARVLRSRPGTTTSRSSDFMGGPGRRWFEFLAWFDRTVIDGAVNGIGGAARGSGVIVRRAPERLRAHLRAGHDRSAPWR